MNSTTTTNLKLELRSDIDKLKLAAREAALAAYCPYSHFRVGAAALTADGTIFTGCNVENASYGLSICAERVAIFKAVAEGDTSITAIAVACLDGNPSKPESLMPCGACRQVMAEFMEPDAKVIVDHVDEFRLSELLPNPFRLPK